MGQRIRKIIGFVMTLLLIVVFITVPGHLLRPVDCDICTDAIDTFHDMPENTIEVIGYGSSHIWRGLNVMEMYEEYGVGAYNYGCNWQHINTTLLFLEDSFKTQSPDVVLIECYRVNELLYDVDMDGEIYYTTHIEDSEYKREYLDQCFVGDTERYLSYYVPIVGFHDNWAAVGGKSFMESSNRVNLKKTMGYVHSKGQIEVSIGDPNTFIQSRLSDAAINVLDKMVALCKENGTEIIFFTIPYEADFQYGNAMKKYAEENDCVYLDFFELADEVGIDPCTDFEGGGHTNVYGATKIANYLGKYIVENYNVTDMREVENNLWEQALLSQ